MVHLPWGAHWLALGIDHHRLRNQFAARHTFGRRREVFNPWMGYRDEDRGEKQTKSRRVGADVKKPHFFCFPLIANFSPINTEAFKFHQDNGEPL